MGYPGRVINYLHTSIQRSWLNAFHQILAVGVIIFIGFPLSYIVWVDWFPQHYENLSLRLLGSLLGLGLILTPWWPQWMRRYLPWYWLLSLMFTFSFFFAYLFLMNHASIISAMSLLCGVFLLVLLVDLPSLFILLVSGWGLALLSYFNSPVVYFGEEHLEMLIIVIFVIVAGALLNHKTTVMQQQRLAGMAAVAGMIAHELRTPLLGIKSGAKAMTQYSPQLLNAYALAKEHGLLSTTLRESRLQQIARINERIISEIDYANTIIDMLLIKSGRENLLQNCILEECTMAECLNDALKHYPFKSANQRALISWYGDFLFVGSKLLMKHVLYNLLKNALYAIATAHKGEITIWAIPGEKFNSLYVKDSAMGMSVEQQSHLFNHFYTTTFMGTGLGLAFCKLVLNRFGGDIFCESKEGKYTQFMLTFPVP